MDGAWECEASAQTVPAASSRRWDASVLSAQLARDPLEKGWSGSVVGAWPLASLWALKPF
jgi:hypothetical protein